MAHYMMNIYEFASRHNNIFDSDFNVMSSYEAGVNSWTKSLIQLEEYNQICEGKLIHISYMKTLKLEIKNQVCHLKIINILRQISHNFPDLTFTCESNTLCKVYISKKQEFTIYVDIWDDFLIEPVVKVDCFMKLNALEYFNDSTLNLNLNVMVIIESMQYFHNMDDFIYTIDKYFL